MTALLEYISDHSIGVFKWATFVSPSLRDESNKLLWERVQEFKWKI